MDVFCCVALDLPQNRRFCAKAECWVKSYFYVSEGHALVPLQQARSASKCTCLVPDVPLASALVCSGTCAKDLGA